MIQHPVVLLKAITTILVVTTTPVVVTGYQAVYPTTTTTTTTTTTRRGVSFSSLSLWNSHTRNGFVFGQQQQQQGRRSLYVGLSSSSSGSNNNDNEELRRAAALTDYLARAHSDKLRAIAAVEQQKDEQIRTLQNELATLQIKFNNIVEQQQHTTTSIVSSSYIPTKNSKLSDLSKDELIELVEQYIDFVATYIVNASIERNKAVKAAEAALNQKWEDKLTTLNIQLPSSSSSSTAAVVTATTTAAAAAATTVVEPASVAGTTTTTPAATEGATTVAVTAGTLYGARNAKVVAAAGNSRWGTQEIQKIGGGSTTPVVVSTTTVYSGINGDTSNIGSKILHTTTANGSIAPTQYTTLDVISNKDAAERIVEADHGIASDGTAQDKLSLTERIVAGAFIEPVGKTKVAVQQQQQPVPVPAIVVSNIDPSNIDITTIVEEADHGIASDGTVNGKLSLLDRVLAGASLSESTKHTLHTSSSQEQQPIAVVAADASSIVPNGASSSNTASLLYELRNKQLLSSASSTSTRWGSKELNKIQAIIISSSSSSSDHHHAATTETSTTNSIYDLRNQKIVTASNVVGKSNRWGTKEIEKIRHYATNGPTKVVTVVPTATNTQEDDTIILTSLYQQRNANIIAAAQIGKSRWGTREIQKTKKTKHQASTATK